ncbi:hypothetical protein [Anaeromyxobacter sp. PSR-1]|uniref:hypothetical protein n=1 Tax=Anaeromyxobacter sp. PSR-1 TaxID=1300915 RepID=UPI0005E4B1C4|nr:hypothetical protein [Anaeromyxobacter sp. PSR-1]GAO01927.1 hypothetical protein PSR1_00790 [Anaeromyxobacter sp. PSR-1]
MATNKEDIYAALYARLSGSVTGLTTISRRLKSFESTDPSEQPAMFVHQSSVESVSTTGMPSKQTVRAEVYVYVYKDADEGPMPTLNGIVHQIETALERKAADPLAHAKGNTTLGKAVASARLTGIEYGGGLGDGAQGVAIISVELVVPS